MKDAIVRNVVQELGNYSSIDISGETGGYIRYLRYPRLSNTQDAEVYSKVRDPLGLMRAQAVILGKIVG